MEATWLLGQRVGLSVQQSQIQVLLWPVAGFVLGRSEFKSPAMLVISQLVASCQVGFLILLCSIWILYFRIIQVECL